MDSIVFTNGCFDLFHYGHLYLLREAKKFGGTLIVGINTDASVRRLKGASRPIFPLKHRSEILSSLIYVDGVIPFDEDTPLNIIKKIKPTILVKGADWENNIIGTNFVKAYGGVIKTIPLLKGLSTTGIMESIKRREK